MTKTSNAGFKRNGPDRSINRCLIVLAGILVGQAILYGPSLIGRKILLPLDILQQAGFCIPAPPGTLPPTARRYMLIDLVTQNEPDRHFAWSEIHAGRFPVWNPTEYAGVPHSMLTCSPFGLLGALVESPKILPWIELLAAICSGFGAYLFFRRALRVSFWPAAIAAWCYPLTAFFIFWQGYGIALAVVWLPWMLLAVHQTVSGASRLAPVGLAVATCLTLISGKLDTAGQVLLTSGFYAVWCLWDVYRSKLIGRKAVLAIMTLSAGWGLGFLLAAPGVLPIVKYAHTGVRITSRGAGKEERPPDGLGALPQVVLPDIYGADELGSLRGPLQFKGQGSNIFESSAAAYAGLLFTLFAAPLAWCSRRHRSVNAFWLVLGFIGLSWCLNIPGVVDVLRLPGLNMMSHNRFVFATSFAILALGVVGLDVLWQGGVRWHAWFWLPMGLLLAICVWAAFRTMSLPEVLQNGIGEVVRRGGHINWVFDADDVREVQNWFIRHYAVSGILAGIGGACWILLRAGKSQQGWFAPLCSVLLVGDLLLFAQGRRTQSDPALYYPPIPALDAIRSAAPGRTIASGCFPAALPTMYGLRDIRGYDAIDPARLMDLMRLVKGDKLVPPAYAFTQMFVPTGELLPPDGVRLSPILDMLGVRYVIFRGKLPPKVEPAIQSPDFWVMVNRSALPRAFVPHRVEMFTDRAKRLEWLASTNFNPREAACVEIPLDLPNNCRGSAQIIGDIPTHVTISAKMDTPGLVVLADLWDAGWLATVQGKPAPILRVNHAIRGVAVPAGESVIEFRYEPAGLRLGLGLMAFAMAVILGWILVASRISRKSPPA